MGIVRASHDSCNNAAWKRQAIAGLGEVCSNGGEREPSMPVTVGRALLALWHDAGRERRRYARRARLHRSRYGAPGMGTSLASRYSSATRTARRRPSVLVRLHSLVLLINTPVRCTISDHPANTREALSTTRPTRATPAAVHAPDASCATRSWRRSSTGQSLADDDGRAVGRADATAAGRSRCRKPRCGWPRPADRLRPNPPIPVAGAFGRQTASHGQPVNWPAYRPR